MTVIINSEDLGKSRLELLTDLIYESEGIRVPLSKIRYSPPEKLDVRPEVLNDPNTLIRFDTDSDYDDRFHQKLSNALMYRRREISKHFQDVTFPLTIYVDSDGDFTIHEILNQINLNLSYPLAAEDIINQRLNSQSVTSLILQSNPESLIWIDSVTIPVNITYANRLNLLTNTELDGFFQMA